MKKFDDIQAVLRELNEEALYFDGFEQALIGYSSKAGDPIVACYDYDKCINILMRRDKMSEEEAIEFFEFNTVGAYVGKHTHAILKQL